MWIEPRDGPNPQKRATTMTGAHDCDAMEAEREVFLRAVFGDGMLPDDELPGDLWGMLWLLSGRRSFWVGMAAEAIYQAGVSDVRDLYFAIALRHGRGDTHTHPRRDDGGPARAWG